MFKLSNIQDYISYSCWYTVKVGKIAVSFGSCQQNNSWRYISSDFLRQKINTSNLLFGRAILDKLSKCIFENFENARVKQGQFQNFQKSRG